MDGEGEPPWQLSPKGKLPGAVAKRREGVHDRAWEGEGEEKEREGMRAGAKWGRK